MDLFLFNLIDHAQDLMLNVIISIDNFIVDLKEHSESIHNLFPFLPVEMRVIPMHKLLEVLEEKVDDKDAKIVPLVHDRLGYLLAA